MIAVADKKPYSELPTHSTIALRASKQFPVARVMLHKTIR